MTWEAGLTLGIVALMIVGLVRHPKVADVTFVGALSLLTLAGAGYQTHLMVFGPGGTRARDFIRAGIPMVALWFVITPLVVPWVWY